MKTGSITKKELYYTKDHEWIEFQGPVAYIGVCAFKLIGYREIEEIVYYGLSGFKKQGEKIAHIRYKDYQVCMHMPVDGEIQVMNNILLSGNRNILLQKPESNGWFALINIARPEEKNGLLSPKEYLMLGKNKYAK